MYQWKNQAENDKLKKGHVVAKSKFCTWVNFTHFTHILRYIWSRVDDSSRKTYFIYDQDNVIGGSNLAYWLAFWN